MKIKWFMIFATTLIINSCNGQNKDESKIENE
jgi:hypothetical protein